MDLVLRQVIGRDPESAQRTKTGVDAVNRARLRGQRFHELPAAPNQRSRLVG